VIVVHGNSRNPDAYFDYVMDAAQTEGVEGTTIIIAPHYQASEDEPASDEFYWSREGWKQGDQSKNGSPRRSSFYTMDQIVRLLGFAHRFPNLDTIVLTGHSAGGQFVQRYAVGSAQQQQLRHGIFFRYVVTNPGSYVYLNDMRPRRADPTDFWRPSISSECRSYDNYKYGLRNRNSYMSQLNNAELIEQYRFREVVYFLGEEDVVRGSDLDLRCEAEHQGINRFMRGLGYINFMNEFYSPHYHLLMTVPGIDHCGWCMYNSAAGRYLLFH
jgi:hypothetical protein